MRTSERLLLVDDDETALTLMKDLLENRGFRVDCARDADRGEALLKKTAYHVVVADLKMPGRSGMDLVQLCRREYPEIPVVVITGRGSIRSAVEVLKAGAFDYLSKPVQMDELTLVIRKALAGRRLETQNTFLRGELKRTLDYLHETANAGFRRIYRTVDMIKDEDTSLLLQGESGTGKEVIARLIHNSGRRSAGSFVPINCGAIPEGLIESELFGYERGAFTGAEKRTPGKLEIADGGTLFLDEIDELPPKAQVALLRFIQEREIVPLGSTRRISVNVRLIAATNRDLESLIRSGGFREDLYYRINVLPLYLPPLRERREDILPFCEWFLKSVKTAAQRPARGFSAAARSVLVNYHWPGNMRELRNVVDRAAIICRGPLIEPEALLLPGEPPDPNPRRRSVPGPVPGSIPAKKSPPPVMPSPTAENPPSASFAVTEELTLEELEMRYIRWMLARRDGNRTQCAEALGISLRGLRYKLNALEDDLEDASGDSPEDQPEAPAGN